MSCSWGFKVLSPLRFIVRVPDFLMEVPSLGGHGDVQVQGLG